MHSSGERFSNVLSGSPSRANILRTLNAILFKKCLKIQRHYCTCMCILLALLWVCQKQWFRTFFLFLWCHTSSFTSSIVVLPPRNMSRAANLCYKQWSRPQINQLTSPEITCSDSHFISCRELVPDYCKTLNFGHP